MSRRINQIMIQELSTEEIYVLQDLWNPQVGDFIFVNGNEKLITSINKNSFGTHLFYGDSSSRGCVEKNCCVPLLSNWQMIEILRHPKHFYFFKYTFQSHLLENDKDFSLTLWAEVKKLISEISGSKQKAQ